MNVLLSWISTNKAKLLGLLSILLTAGIMPFLINKGYITATTAGEIIAVLSGLGLMSAKDSNNHSTVDQVTAATEKKIVASTPVPTPVVIVPPTPDPIIVAPPTGTPTLVAPTISSSDLVLKQIADIINQNKA